MAYVQVEVRIKAALGEQVGILNTESSTVQYIFCSKSALWGFRNAFTDCIQMLVSENRNI